MKAFEKIPSQFRANVIIDVPSYPAVKEGKRIVDESYYVPNKEANKILAKQQVGQMLNDLMYDSPEDIKNGFVNVYARQRGRDLAELTQQARNLQDKAEAGIAEAMDKVRKEKAKQAEKPAPAQSSSTETPVNA